ncbi:hypothetical protein, partial [Stenotrophomonas lactitubi]|uniref:hypothetical protein n=1 Tax=Stenotrophomonas lactitubi TaxID=2045214 RepID=UPI00320876C1
AMLRAVLDNTPGPALDIVALNAGAALYVAGVASAGRQSQQTISTILMQCRDVPRQPAMIA